MHEDQVRALLLSLARLERQLQFAQRVFKEGEDHGRIGAIAAINAAAEFVRSIDEFYRDDLAMPLITVSSALTDLDEGAKRHPMLAPKLGGGRQTRHKGDASPARGVVCHHGSGDAGRDGPGRSCQNGRPSP